MVSRAKSWIAPRSLRVRLSIWYIVFTFACMSAYGALLSQFLKHELRASREETMRRREHRFLTYMATELKDRRNQDLSESMRHFMEASPETDRLEILDESRNRIYPKVDPMLPLPSAAAVCVLPCVSLLEIGAHPVRILTHHTLLNGRPVWIVMGGQIDEHYDILKAVRAGYFLLLPMVLLGSVAGGYALSRRALLPVGRLTEKARGLSITVLNGRLPVPQTGDELQSLAEAWNDLLVRLEAEVNRSTQFTADASHDLRTAITVILANAQLSLRRIRSPEEYRETLSTILQEATHMLNLLEEMLLVARSGKLNHQVARAPVSFAAIVLDIFEAARATAEMKGLKMRVGTVDDIQVLGDAALLRRLMSTLLDNALKYTPAGGTITVAVRRVEQGAVLSVQDTGIGIPGELHPRVFDRLFRADVARSRAGTKGNGLGLSIAKWIADMHGFSIRLESVVDAGTTFFVLLPEAALTPRTEVGSELHSTAASRRL